MSNVTVEDCLIGKKSDVHGMNLLLNYSKVFMSYAGIPRLTLRRLGS